MAPVVVRPDWLQDTYADQVGASTLALVLTLTARAAQPDGRGRLLAPVTIAPDTWCAYLDDLATARCCAAGLVEQLRTGSGQLLGVRCGAWLLAHLDTDQAINRRVLTRERMQRLRLRRRDAGLQQQLFHTCPGEGRRLRAVNDLPGRLDVWKSCAEPARVTPAVTHASHDALYTRAGMRAEVRTSTDPIVQGSKAAKIVEQQKTGAGVVTAEARQTFRLLLAVTAAARRTRWCWRYVTSEADRQDLLDAIRTDMLRARLPVPTDREIRKAITIDERSDAMHRAASGRGGR